MKKLVQNTDLMLPVMVIFTLVFLTLWLRQIYG